MEGTANFFGLTTLGPPSPLVDASAAASVREFSFHDIPTEVFDDVFKRHLIGDTTMAKVLRVDGSTNILRKDLAIIVSEVLGRVPTKAELTTWFSYTDFDRGATMTFEEYSTAVANLQAFCAQPQQAQQYKSYQRIWDDKTKHRRVQYEPQQTLREPLTASQAVGWHATKAAAPHDFSKNLVKTDVTINEGWSPLAYYGFLNVKH